MTKQRGDKKTLDIFDWEPPEIVDRFDDRDVRTATLRGRIARAVSTTLKNSDKSRDQIAEEMSDFLDETITKNMLNRYASETGEEHTISYVRLLALVHATDDVRPLQIGAEIFKHSIVDDRYLKWVDVGKAAEKKDELNKIYDGLRREARRAGK